ncbi:hypothetical protein ABWK26_28510, partial [Bacillus toyonensis]
LVDIFDRQDGSARWATFDFRLFQRVIKSMPAEIYRTITFGKAIVHRIYQTHDICHVEKHSEVRNLFIPTGSITCTKFSLSKSDQNFLYESGYQAVKSFLTHGVLRNKRKYIEMYIKGNRSIIIKIEFCFCVSVGNPIFYTI